MAGHDRELAERSLVVIPVLARWFTVDKQLYDRNVPFSATEEQKYARRRFKVSPEGFTAILVGKDGEEKMRSQIPITAAKLFEAIDVMPMRRQEMQKP